MAETLQDGDLLGVGYFDGDRGAREPYSKDGDLYDMGSVLLGWGLDSANCPNSTHIDLTFGGPVSVLGLILTDPLSYSISPALAVKSATAVSEHVIQLETAQQQEGVEYTITITAIEDEYSGGGGD